MGINFLEWGGPRALGKKKAQDLEGLKTTFIGDRKN